MGDPVERLRRALSEVYAYYRRNEGLLSYFAAAAHENPEVRAAGEPLFRYWRRERDVVAAGWDVPSEQRLLLAVLDLALDFQTWRTLVRRGGLEQEQSVELAARMVGSSPGR